MPADSVADLIARVDGDRMRADLFHLSEDPLPFRKVNYTRPGADKCSLDEADDYIRASFTACGYAVEDEAVEVQAFACDSTLGLHGSASACACRGRLATCATTLLCSGGETHGAESTLRICACGGTCCARSSCS